LRFWKKCHQDLCLLRTYYTCYTSFFSMKIGEKWFTCNVLSPTCFCSWAICGSLVYISSSQVVPLGLALVSSSWPDVYVLIRFPQQTLEFYFYISPTCTWSSSHQLYVGLDSSPTPLQSILLQLPTIPNTLHHNPSSCYLCSL
jgi:hypothetical protein